MSTLEKLIDAAKKEGISKEKFEEKVEQKLNNLVNLQKLEELEIYSNLLGIRPTKKVVKESLFSMYIEGDVNSAKKLEEISGFSDNDDTIGKALKYLLNVEDLKNLKKVVESKSKYPTEQLLQNKYIENFNNNLFNSIKKIEEITNTKANLTKDMVNQKAEELLDKKRIGSYEIDELILLKDLTDYNISLSQEIFDRNCEYLLKKKKVLLFFKFKETLDMKPSDRIYKQLLKNICY